eukprot:4915979-Prymnesium_polylepis.1
MWSRPAGPTVTAIQSFLITHPRFSSLLATGAMGLEIAFVVAPANDYVSLFIGVNGLLFHFGILLLQGLDFCSYWAPCLLVFLVGVPSSEPWSAVLNGLDHETGFFLPAVIYTALQVRWRLTEMTITRTQPFTIVSSFALCTHTGRAASPKRCKGAVSAPRARRVVGLNTKASFDAGRHGAHAARLLARRHSAFQLLPDVHAAAQHLRRLAQGMDHVRLARQRHDVARRRRDGAALLDSRLACLLPL